MHYLQSPGEQGPRIHPKNQKIPEPCGVAEDGLTTPHKFFAGLNVKARLRKREATCCTRGPADIRRSISADIQCKLRSSHMCILIRAAICPTLGLA